MHCALKGNLSLMKFRFQRKYLALPYLAFLLLFVVLPIILIVYYAFSDSTGRLSIWPLQNFFSDTDKLEVLVISLIFGFINTVLCLLIGYPVSMLLANKKYNKNIVLVMLFIKYISDKWGGQLYSPITIPEGASFTDMVKLKGCN